MHDGGKNVTFTLNDKLICTSTAIYTALAPGAPSHDSMAGMNMAMDSLDSANGQPAAPIEAVVRKEAISDTTRCTDTIPVKKGDFVKLAVNFDLKEHGMRVGTGGKSEPVMGLATFNLATAPGTVIH